MSLSIVPTSITKGLEKIAHETGVEVYLTQLTENEQACVGFGMAPQHVMEKFEDETRKNISKAYCEAKGYNAGDVKPESVDDNLINDTSRAFYLGLLDGAKQAGKMVV